LGKAPSVCIATGRSRLPARLHSSSLDRPEGLHDAPPDRGRSRYRNAERQVIVDEPDALHEGVRDRRAHEAEPRLRSRSRGRVRFGRGGGDIAHAARRQAMLSGPRRPVARYEAKLPCSEAVARKAAALPIVAIDLGAVADYAGIGEEPSAIGVVITGDAPRVEAAERQSERPSLSQNRDPARPAGSFSRASLSNRSRSSETGTPHSES